MHTPTMILVLLWLQTRTLGSAASVPIKGDTGTTTLRAGSHVQLSSHIRPDAAEVVDYPIPGTSTTIHFILGHPLPPAIMSNTIISAYNFIIFTIASEGDSTLPKSKDPFTYSADHRAFIRAGSAAGRHLTWSLLEGAVVGLWNGLYQNGKYRASVFWIRDARAGLLGVGEMGVEDIAGGEWRNGMADVNGLAKVKQRGSSGGDSDGVVD